VIDGDEKPFTADRLADRCDQIARKASQILQAQPLSKIEYLRQHDSLRRATRMPHHVPMPPASTLSSGSFLEPIYDRVTPRAATVEGLASRASAPDRARGGY